MNAETLSPLAALGKGSPQGARVARGQAGNRHRGIPPIEQRFSPPPGNHSRRDPMAVWPARPGLSRDSRQRAKGSWVLGMLALGAVVFVLGVANVITHKNPAGPLTVRLMYAL